MKVVVCGAGAVGAACAYFLSRRGADVVVVERAGVACAASGKSGGFLALDWCDGSPLEALARRSFALHEALVDEIGGDWGYRRMITYSGVSGQRGDGAGPLPWLSSAVALHGRIGSPETTAQVHPARFTESLMRAAQEAGVQLVTGEVTGLSRDEAGAVRGVTVDGDEIAADRVVLAMGPWSLRAAGWLDLPAVHAVKGHSLVFSAADIPAEALFLEHRDAEGRTTSPELFPRADGTVYACAISSESPLPDDPAETRSDAGAIERLEAICHAISPALSPDRVIARQACHRPVTRDGLPLIGPVPEAEGAVVATGHGVWGILNAPATGEAVAKLLLDDTSRTVDISSFDPGRLPPMCPDGRHPVTARRTLLRHGATRERE
jgi:glycine/D-amino acid oxidase-like deaminating enzyme